MDWGLVVEAGADKDEGRIPRWVRQAIFLWWGVFVALWALLIVSRQLRSLLIQLALALFLSFAMEPTVDRLANRGMKRSSATALTMFGVVAFFVGFLTAMGSLMATQVNQLATDLPGYVTSAESWAEDRFDIDIESDTLLSELSDGGQASQYLSAIADNVVGVGAALAGVLFQVLTILLFAFYLTADGPRVRSTICRVLPPARQHDVLNVWELAITKTGAFLTSRFVLAAISALVHWVVFRIVGLPSTLALAIWVGLISQFIPVVGTYIAGVVPALIALAIEPTMALWIIATVVIYQQIENYLIQPRVTAQSLNMHPAVAFGAVLAGTATFGAPGALLALPALATIQSFISAFIEHHDVVENRLLGPVVAALGDEDDQGDEAP